MAFNAGGSSSAYRGREVGARQSQGQLTAAEDRLGKKRKQDRIDSETSDMAGIANIARAGLAIYTGGASEASGLGAMGSKALQGKKSDGSDYDDQMGDIIGTVAGGYNMMEGMKQKDISDLKSEDISNYERDIEYSKQFAEGSDDRKGALLAARERLENSQSAQKYGDRADSNPFTYKKGRRDAPALSPLAVEGSAVDGVGIDQDGNTIGSKVPQIDKNAIPDSVQKGKAEFDSRQEPSPDAHAKSIEEENLKRRALEEARTSAREDASRTGYKTDAAKEEDRRSVREGASRQGYKTTDQILDDAEKRMSVGKVDEDRMWDKLSEQDDMDQMMDREYDKKLALTFQNNNDPSLLPYAEYEADHEGKVANMLAGKGYGYKPSMGKTFSEKEAEKLSSKDRDGSSAMDDIAFDNKGRALEERGGFLRGYDRLLNPKQGKEDAQHLLEYKRNQKEALAREHARTGGPNFPKHLSGEKSFKSALRKRMEKRQQEAKEVALKRGGVLAGSSAQ